MTDLPPLPDGWEYGVLHVVRPDHPMQEIPTALDRFISGVPSFIDEHCEENCLLVMVKKKERLF